LALVRLSRRVSTPSCDLPLSTGCCTRISGLVLQFTEEKHTTIDPLPLPTRMGADGRSSGGGCCIQRARIIDTHIVARHSLRRSISFLDPASELLLSTTANFPTNFQISQRTPERKWPWRFLHAQISASCCRSPFWPSYCSSHLRLPLRIVKRTLNHFPKMPSTVHRKPLPPSQSFQHQERQGQRTVKGSQCVGQSVMTSESLRVLHFN
jgi:hypothetical protein